MARNSVRLLPENLGRLSDCCDRTSFLTPETGSFLFLYLGIFALGDLSPHVRIPVTFWRDHVKTLGIPGE